MSVSIGVALECGPVPDGVVPPDQMSYGQNVVRYLGRLASVADQLGVPQLDSFIIYRQELVLEALHKAGWRPPDPPPEWGDEIPIDDRYLTWMRTDPTYLAAQAEEERIVARVD